MKQLYLPILIILALVVLVGCAAEKPLIPKDTGISAEVKEQLKEKNPEEVETIYIYDQIKKTKYWMNKTSDAGNKCKVAAECIGWCEPVEGAKEGKCSWFPKPIGCKKRFERFEIFDVCANLTVAQP